MDRESTAYLIISTMPRIHKKLFQSIESKYISKQVLGILYIISCDEGMPIGYYSDKLLISKPNFTKTINRMIDVDKLIRRESDPSDRRVIRLYVTDLGNEILARRMQELREGILERLSTLEDEDIVRLDSSISAVGEIIDKL